MKIVQNLWGNLYKNLHFQKKTKRISWTVIHRVRNQPRGSRERGCGCCQISITFTSHTSIAFRSRRYWGRKSHWGRDFKNSEKFWREDVFPGWLNRQWQDCLWMQTNRPACYCLDFRNQRSETIFPSLPAKALIQLYNSSIASSLILNDIVLLSRFDPWKKKQIMIPCNKL